MSPEMAPAASQPAPEPWPTTPAAPEPAPAVAHPRGIGWASNIGWGVAALGLALILYAFYWADTHFPKNYNPGGISGSKAGAVVALIGVILGFLFLFIPHVGTPHAEPGAVRAAWRDHRASMKYMQRTSRIISWVGVGILLLGLSLAAAVLRADVLASRSVNTYRLLGIESSFTYWAASFLILGAAGAFLWAVFWARANALQHAIEAYEAAGSDVPEAAMAPPAVPGPATMGAWMPVGVERAELLALMKRLDGMLSVLPEDQVASFSKSKEAETYLKILSSKPAEQAPPGGKR